MCHAVFKIDLRVSPKSYVIVETFFCDRRDALICVFGLRYAIFIKKFEFSMCHFIIVSLLSTLIHKIKTILLLTKKVAYFSDHNL